MHALSTADFLSLWEDGQRLHSLDRGVLAVQCWFPGAAGESVADWSLGRRNQALARLHAQCFGSRIEGWTACGGCGEKLEFKVDCRALIERQGEGNSQPVEFKGQVFRAPTSRDLARIAGECDAERAALRLVGMCRIESGDERIAGDGGPAGWSGEELEQLGEAIAAADPLAEIALSLACPVCGLAREEALDLPAFLWAELEACAKRILNEVHALATAYGWSESEILSLSDARRALYLEMVQA